ncbi:MAG: Methyltransferase domain protein [Chloroflexi bacterium ADurb.Bin180]|nr:MAG: Methyltransferase domain protein [Chloroflexi bacterium ADurb.Bin180]
MLKIDYSDRDVLEIGCGSGRFTKEHLRQAGSVMGLDSDLAALDILRTDWPRLSQAVGDWRVGSVPTFPLPAEEFDVAVISQTL